MLLFNFWVSKVTKVHSDQTVIILSVPALICVEALIVDYHTIKAVKMEEFQS